MKEKLWLRREKEGFDRPGTCDGVVVSRAELESCWPGYKVESVVRDADGSESGRKWKPGRVMAEK